MRVLLFAGLAEAVGHREVDFDFGSAVGGDVAGEATVDELVARLREVFPALAGHVFRVAVDQRYVRGDEPVTADAEVALIPPVSGGRS